MAPSNSLIPVHSYVIIFFAFPWIWGKCPLDFCSGLVVFNDLPAVVCLASSICG